MASLAHQWVSNERHCPRNRKEVLVSLDRCSFTLENLNIGMVYSGMGPDYRVLVDKARKVSHTNYKRIYNEYPPTRILVQDVARVMQEATQSGGVRPYGVSLPLRGC